jgi:4-hydroxybutyrate CoA-transferase
MVTIDQDEFLGLFRPGQRVYVGGSSNEPTALIELLASKVEGVTFIQQPLVINRFDLSALGDGCRQVTFFMTPVLRDGYAEGRVDFIPMQMRAIFDYLSQDAIDIALLQAARDVNGVLRFGPNVDYVGAALRSARQVVIQVNPEFVAPLGCPQVDAAAPYLLVECASEKPLYPETRVDETSQKIGRLVASIVHDGDCLQTGIGAVPAAILADLTDRSDLGFHGGLVDDGVMNLARNGNLNGARKAIDRGKHITGMALGSAALLDWVANADSVVFKSADYTHEVSVIRQLDNFVSVNSAVEVDLFGQVNAEVTGGRQISGTGGSVDFMRAAKASRNGRSVVAMSATARRGEVSRIVPKAEMVTALRTDVDMVVTEFGIARLKDVPLQERARRLIDIAHPNFRDELLQQLRDRRLM